MDSFFLDSEENLEEEKVDFSRYFRAIAKRWWIVVLVTLVVAVPWAIYLKSEPPIYEANALIRFNNVAGSDLDLAQSRTTQLTSRSFAEKVVEQLGLALKWDHKNNSVKNRSEIFKEFTTTRQAIPGNYVLHLTTDGRYSLSQLTDSDGKAVVIKKGNLEDIIESSCSVNGFSFRIIGEDLSLPLEISFGIQPFRKAVESFQNRILLTWEDRARTLLNVNLTDTDPVVVANMANRLAEIFIEESSSIKKSTVQTRQSILEEQLKEAKAKLDASEQELKRFKEKYNVNLEGDPTDLSTGLADLQLEQQNLETTINVLNDLLVKKEQASITGDTDTEDTEVRYIMNEITNLSVFDDNPTMLLYRRRLEGLEESWKNVVEKSTPEHFRAREILRDIKTLHVQIESIARQELGDLNDKLTMVKQEVARAETRLKLMPTLQQKYDALKRENEVLVETYQDLLGKTREAQISAAVETEDIEILDPAIVPELPTNHDKKIKAAIGGLAGLFLGVLVVMMLEVFNKSIRTAEEVRRFLKLPVLGTIPQIDFSDVYEFQDSEKVKQIDHQLVTHDYSPTPIGEAYRSLRTNLMFTKETGRIRSLVITSNEPGDGKSFTAANLAITLAQLKSSTLLVDADLRRGVLHNTFGVPKEPGFSNYLTDVVPLQSIIHETQIPNLSMISCGSLIPNPSELLGSHQMQRFMDEVRRKFDLVVFDTPPLNAATDAVVVGTQADATVVVIRAGKTNRDLAKSKLELYSSVPANVIGVILNGTTADMAHPGYSYYHY